MHRRLAIQQGRGFWASRGAAIAAIILLHAGLATLGLMYRSVRQESEPTLVSVSLLSPVVQPLDSPAPVASVPRFEVPAPVVLLPPQFASDTTESVAENTITVAVQPAVAREPAPEATPTTPLRVSRAEYLRAPVLRYPPAALAARREGSVGLRVLVSAEGRVMEVEVERPSGYPPFDEAACNAVRAALFKPYTVNGEPRSVLIRIPIDFTLKRRSA